jgi:molecular chaperone HscA
MQAQIDSVRAARAGHDADAIKQAVEALAKGTEEFAARRMNAAVKRALQGRRLDEIA